MARPYKPLSDKELHHRLHAALMAERRIRDARSRLDEVKARPAFARAKPKVAKKRS